MPTIDPTAHLAANLAANLKFLRERRGLTQDGLSRLSGIPRPTLAGLEAGSGNPTLTVLARLSLGLGVPLEELISSPRGECRIFKRGELPIKGEGRKVTVNKLLPDPIPGMEIDRVEIAPAANLKGTPHRPGTREYLYCEKGAMALWVAGEKYELHAGDVAAFPGEAAHSYHNAGATRAVGFSVVTLPPFKLG